jgi:hypothetical protein
MVNKWFIKDVALLTCKLLELSDHKYKFDTCIIHGVKTLKPKEQQKVEELTSSKPRSLLNFKDICRSCCTVAKHLKYCWFASFQLFVSNEWIMLTSSHVFCVVTCWSKCVMLYDCSKNNGLGASNSFPHWKQHQVVGVNYINKTNKG